MGLTFLAIFSKFEWTWYTLELLMLSFGLIVITFIDLDHRIIPDEFSLTGIVLGLIGAALNPERLFFDSFLGILIGGGFFWMIAYLYQVLRKEEGLGGGDIKLLAWLGAYLGWHGIPFIILCSSLIGTVFGLVLILRGGTMKTAIPFGPFIVGAAFLYLFVGEELGKWYLQLFLDFPIGK